MLKIYNSLTKMKSTLQEKARRRLEFNSEYEADTELIDDFIDTAITELRLWRRLEKDDEFLSGAFDAAIVQFVVESYNKLGIEGQSYESNGATAKQFTETPLSRLKSSVSQRI